MRIIGMSIKSCRNLVRISSESLEYLGIVRISLEYSESHQNIRNLTRIFTIPSESWESIGFFGILSKSSESHQNLRIPLESAESYRSFVGIWNLIKISSELCLNLIKILSELEYRVKNQLIYLSRGSEFFPWIFRKSFRLFFTPSKIFIIICKMVGIEMLLWENLDFPYFIRFLQKINPHS